MEMTIRIYIMKPYRSTRTIFIDEGTLDEMVGDYLTKYDYIDHDERIDMITYESINL